MHIRIGKQLLKFRAYVFSPIARKGHEESLVGRESIDGSLRLAFLRFQERCVGDGKSAQVADALAKHELAIFVEIARDDEGIKLFLDAQSALLEILGVFRRPPVAEITGG